MTPRSWERWIPYYEAKGYRVLAPAYPGLEVEVEALNRDPSPIERLTVPLIVDHLERVVRGLDAPPILMGHSAGGAFMQVLLDRGSSRTSRRAAVRRAGAATGCAAPGRLRPV